MKPMKPMNAITLPYRPIALGLLAIAFSALVFQRAQAGGSHYFPPVGDPVVKEECGSCHLAFPPSMLPASSWKRMMGELTNHFGDDASVDPATARHITNYLAEQCRRYRRPTLQRKTTARDLDEQGAAAHHRTRPLGQGTPRSSRLGVAAQGGAQQGQLPGLPRRCRTRLLRRLSSATSTTPDEPLLDKTFRKRRAPLARPHLRLPTAHQPEIARMTLKRILPALAIGLALGAASTWVTPAFSDDKRAPAAAGPADRQWLSIPQIVDKLEAAGYRNIEKIEREHGNYEVRATNRDGKRSKLYVHPQTGEVIDHRQRARERRRWRTQERLGRLQRTALPRRPAAERRRCASACRQMSSNFHSPGASPGAEDSPA
jgi:hypothetical protein